MKAELKIPYMPPSIKNDGPKEGPKDGPTGAPGQRDPRAVQSEQLAAAALAPADLKQLWQQVQTGDAGAFEQVYRACSGPVFGLCLRMTANQAAAEDCTQATFIQAWEKRASFRGDAQLNTWLHRIAVNAVLGRGRSEGRMREVLDDYAEVAVTEQSSPTGGDPDLERAIAALPERGRQVFVLHAIHGYKHDEVGQMMGIAAGTSKAHYHRSRELLQSALRADAAHTIDGVRS